MKLQSSISVETIIGIIREGVSFHKKEMINASEKEDATKHWGSSLALSSLLKTILQNTSQDELKPL